MKDILVHVHIPKNGGTTFNRILARQYGDGFVEAYSQVPGHFFTDDEVRDLLVAHPQTRCLTSHSLRPPLPVLDGIVYRPITFLRHPLERLISLYFYERKITTRTGVEHCSQLPFDQYFEERITQDNALTNWQTFHIAGADDVDKARTLLDTYLFVGITERYDQSLIILSERLDLPLRVRLYRRQRVTPHAPVEAIVNGSLLDRLREMNALDMQLYEHYWERLDRDMSRPTAQWRLRFFAAANSLASSTYEMIGMAGRRTRQLQQKAPKGN